MELASPSGKIIGFDVDMAREARRDVGRRSPSRSKTAFPGLIPALNAKRCDAVISGIFVTPDRMKQAGVVPYMESHRVLIVKAGNPKGIHSPNALKGKVVAVQAGTKYEEYLKALKAKIGFTLQSYPGDTDAVAQVLLGRADAVLTQDTSYAYQAKQHPGKIAIGFTFAAKRLVRDLLPQGRRVDARPADQGRRRAAEGDRHAREDRDEVQDPGRGRQVVRVGRSCLRASTRTSSG